MSFYTIDKPFVYPESADPGPVLIKIPVTSLVSYYTEVIVQMRIFEGSILPGSGSLLDTQSQTVGLHPSTKTDVSFMHTSSIVDSQERRDIEVSVWQGNTEYIEKSWDDIFYVTPVTIPEEPPEGGVFSGTILQVSPSKVQVGMPLQVKVTYEAETSSYFEATNGWWTEVKYVLDGLEGSIATGNTLFGIAPSIFGYDITETLVIPLGIMPGRSLEGTIELLAHKGGFSLYKETIELWGIRIEATIQPTDPGPPITEPVPITPPIAPPGEPPPGEKPPSKEIPWTPIMIGLGSIAAIMLLSNIRK